MKRAQQLVALCLIAGCRHNATVPAPPPAASTPVHFTEIAEQAGLRFRHVNGAHGKKYLPETVGSGVAFLDYDADGWQDVLLVNCTHWPGDPGPQSTPHLFHNNCDGTFTDVTAGSGLDIEIYGMGVAVGDYDGDGFDDVYITALGANHLFHNEAVRRSGGQALGGMPERPNAGTPERPLFLDVTPSSGTQGKPPPEMELKWKWSTGAAWLDYDRDGRLDLFVATYVKWSPATDLFCGRNGIKGYCTPENYQGACCALYHNEGGGRFRDVSAEAGIDTPVTAGKSFGIAVADYNGDGWPDIAVTNDTWANFLFVNEGGKRFHDGAAEAGIALGSNGKPKAGMGIDAADWRNDGRFGILIGNFVADALSLYESDGHGLFADQTHAAGMGASSLPFLTFGLFFFDYDLDGWQDAFAANGHIDDQIEKYDPVVKFRQRSLLYHNMKNGTFDEVASVSGMDRKLVGRGAAYADVDNDGDLDVLTMSNGERAYLFRNDGGNRNHWIRFRCEGTRSNRSGVGALIRTEAGGIRQSQYVRSGGSYLSESQRAVTFGLGGSNRADRIEVVWPSGQVDRTGPLDANRTFLLTEGKPPRIEPRARR